MHDTGAEHARDETRWDEWMEAGLLALERDDTEEAERCLESAVHTAEDLGPDEPRLAASLKALVGVVGYHRRYDEAETLLDRLLDLSVRTLGSDHPDVVACLGHLGWIAERRGETGRARELYRSAFESSQQAYEPEDARALPTLFSLARLYHDDATALADGAAITHEIAARLDDVAGACRRQGRDARATQAETVARRLRHHGAG